MKIKFLVFLAVFCLSASLVASSDTPTVKRTEKVEKKVDVQTSVSEKNKRDTDKQVFRNEYKNDEGKNVDEKITVTKNKNEKEITEKTKVKETEKKTRRTETQEPCSVTIKHHRESCESKCTPGYKPKFTFVDKGEECHWECNYEALPTTPRPKPEKKVVTIKKTKEAKPQKECSGQRQFKVQNCLIKLTGLVAWGDQTRGFDRKFQRLVNQKKRRAAPKRK